MSPERVDFISECFVKPHPIPEASKKPLHLTPWDLAVLSLHYIQKGILYPKPIHPHFSMETFLGKLESSLSLTLYHFYPLAGRLATMKSENPVFYSVFVDCTDGPGARLVRAKVGLTMSDVLLSNVVPAIVHSFFDHDRAINHDGHEMALLTVQVTELVDGIFVGFSMNHAVGDGESFWNFLTAWSGIFRAAQDGRHPPALRPPVHERWFPDGVNPVISLPSGDRADSIGRYEAPPLVEKIFHFPARSIAKLKERANSESGTEKISSFQSLSALVWRCITRTRRFPPDQPTNCRLAINNRTRLNPPLSPDYFGNAVQTVVTIAPAGELLDNNLGWAAWQIHQTVANHNDQKVREFLDSWIKSPIIYHLGHLDPGSVLIGSSPRFNKYGIEFGFGKALALRSGYANKFDGKVSSYPGYEGGGSIDLEVCLPIDSMRALESDNEFMDVATLSHCVDDKVTK